MAVLATLPVPLGCKLYFRERKDKFCSNPFGTDDIYVFPMGLNDFFDNGKTKSGPPFVLSSGTVIFVEAFPDFFLTVFWNSCAVILDGNKDLLMFYSGFYLDGRIVVAELDGII